MDLFGNEDPPAPHPDAEILVPFPEGFDSDDEEVDEPDLVAYFQEQLDGPFRQALDLDLQGDREIVDDVNVTNVEADAGSVMLNTPSNSAHTSAAVTRTTRTRTIAPSMVWAVAGTGCSLGTSRLRSSLRTKSSERKKRPLGAFSVGKPT